MLVYTRVHPAPESQTHHPCEQHRLGLGSVASQAVAPAEADGQEDNQHHDDDKDAHDEPPLLVLPVHLLPQLHPRPPELAGIVPQLLGLVDQDVQTLPSLQNLHLAPRSVKPHSYRFGGHV